MSDTLRRAGVTTTLYGWDGARLLTGPRLTTREGITRIIMSKSDQSIIKPLSVIGVIVLVGAVGFLAGRATLSSRHTTSTTAPIASTVRVLRVSDGIIIEVAEPDRPDRAEHIRLAGVEAPERTNKAYDDAVEALNVMLTGKVVRLEFDTQGRTARDDRDRVLAYVMLDGVNVNVELVRRGWCRLASRYGGGRFGAELRSAEDEARGAKAGMWQDSK